MTRAISPSLSVLRSRSFGVEYSAVLSRLTSAGIGKTLCRCEASIGSGSDGLKHRLRLKYRSEVSYHVESVRQEVGSASCLSGASERIEGLYPPGFLLTPLNAVQHNGVSQTQLRYVSDSIQCQVPSCSRADGSTQCICPSPVRWHANVVGQTAA